MEHILIIGLGSIGIRHLRHFREIGINRIDALRSGKSTMPNIDEVKIDNCYFDLKSALDSKPQGVVICTPSSMHAEAVKAFVEIGAIVLCEKPLTHKRSELEMLDVLTADQKSKIFVAHNLRYLPTLNYLKSNLSKLGEVRMIHAHFGAYLPDWHPWENYKESYTARRDLGGGALLTHIHEPDYVSWIFGLSQFESKSESVGSFIDTNVDEQTILSVKFQNNSLGIITLSLVQKPATRFLQIYTSQGIYSCDLLSHQITFKNLGGATEIIFDEPIFDMDKTYNMQAKDFVRAFKGEDTMLCTYKEQKEVLDLILKK